MRLLFIVLCDWRTIYWWAWRWYQYMSNFNANSCKLSYKLVWNSDSSPVSITGVFYILLNVPMTATPQKLWLATCLQLCVWCSARLDWVGFYKVDPCPCQNLSYMNCSLPVYKPPSVLAPVTDTSKCRVQIWTTWYFSEQYWRSRPSSSAAQIAAFLTILLTLSCARYSVQGCNNWMTFE